MGRIIAICNQKGGVGKTTTAINLSASLAAAEKKTLLVDLDPQGNATSGLGISKHAVQESIYHVLIGKKTMLEVIRPTELAFLQVAPSNTDLAAAELELVEIVSRETRLKAGIKSILWEYDYVIIDCPPSLGLLTLNGMTAAETILIPVQCEYYAMEGLADLYRTIQLVRARLNPTLKVRGVVLTMFDGRNNLSHQVAQEMKNHCRDHVFEAVVPRNVKLSEAPSHGKPVLLYDVKSKGTESYLQLAEEMLKLDAEEDRLIAEQHAAAKAEESKSDTSSGEPIVETGVVEEGRTA